MDVQAPAVRPTSSASAIWATVREAVRGSHQDYTEGPIGRAVILLAIPMVLEMMMESVFAVTDIFFVGRLGADAVATVGITESLMTIIYAVAIGLSIGATATVARRIGEKDPDEAARAAVQSLALGIAGALLMPESRRRQARSRRSGAWRAGLYNTVCLAGVGAIFLIFAPQLIRIFSSDPNVIPYGVRCLRIVAAGFLFYGYGMVLTQSFNGAGDTRTATFIHFVCLWMLEIPLAWVLAYPFGWGPTGVFIAVSVAFSALAIVSATIFKQGKWKTKQV
jgi:Na+-driven multidrug efflux pump